MARIQPSQEPEEKDIRPTPKPEPKPTHKQTVIKPKQQVDTTPKKTPEPAPTKEVTEQPKRRTLQDRRPALKEIQKPVERKIVTKPIYGKTNDVVTKTISETKEVVTKPIGTSKPRLGTATVTATPLQPKKEPIIGRGLGRSAITEARIQQERAIDAARALHTAREREEVDAERGLEQRKRAEEEASYRLSLDTQGRYVRRG